MFIFNVLGDEILKRKDENLRGELLKYAQNIADSKGYDKISIRALAKQAGIATGTVYNYFSNKDEILLAMTDEYWYKALSDMSAAIKPASFDKQLEQIYQYLFKHVLSSASTLMNSLSAVRETGQQRMTSMHTVMRENFIGYLEKDNGIRDEVWTDFFTKEKFTNFIIENIMLSLRMRAKNIDLLVEVVRRILY